MNYTFWAAMTAASASSEDSVGVAIKYIGTMPHVGLKCWHSRCAMWTRQEAISCQWKIECIIVLQQPQM